MGKRLVDLQRTKINKIKIMSKKLIEDSETFQKDRPTKITEEQLISFCKDVAEEIVMGGHSKSTAEQVVEELKSLPTNENGYELVKRLEKSPTDFKCDANLVDLMDTFGADQQDILEGNVSDWVKAHGIKPKFEKGQKLKAKEKLSLTFQKDAELYVIGFKKHLAEYYVHKDKDSKGGYVLTYELVEANCEPAQ